MNVEEKKKRFAMIIVLSGFGFVLLIVGLAKTIGDGFYGFFVPILFVLGWFVFAALSIKYFTMGSK